MATPSSVNCFLCYSFWQIDIKVSQCVGCLSHSQPKAATWHHCELVPGSGSSSVVSAELVLLVRALADWLIIAIAVGWLDVIDVAAAAGCLAGGFMAALHIFVNFGVFFINSDTVTTMFKGL